jgi:hypothetical protein
MNHERIEGGTERNNFDSILKKIDIAFIGLKSDVKILQLHEIESKIQILETFCRELDELIAPDLRAIRAHAFDERDTAALWRAFKAREVIQSVRNYIQSINSALKTLREL